MPQSIVNDRGVFVLPYANDQPSFGAEELIRFGVSFSIREDLVPPPFRVGFRPGSVYGASVPKTAIEEDGQLDRRKRDIGRPSNVVQRFVVDTESMSLFVQGGSKRLLRAVVVSFGPRHAETGLWIDFRFLTAL